MAFDISRLTQWAIGGPNDNKNWHYRSADDTLAAIRASGYFGKDPTTNQQASGMMDVDDIIHAIGSDGHQTLRVDSITGTTVTTASEGGSGNIDFESAETALDNSAQITFAHGLGAAPTRVSVLIRANTATAQGWADNEQSELSFPYKPKVFRGALVRLTDPNGQVQITGGGSGQSVTFDNEIYDTDGFHDNTTNTERLTVPTGVTAVQLAAGVRWQDDASRTRQISFIKNDTSSAANDTYASQTHRGVLGDAKSRMSLVSPVVQVTAGDCFTFNAFTPTTEDVIDDQFTYFSIEVREDNSGADLTWDDTNIYITQGDSLALIDHTSFEYEIIDQTEYDWVVRAWR